MSYTIEERLSFIRSVELDTIAAGSPVPFAAESASVVESSALSFVGNLTGQQREDVMNSTLFAQKAANKQFKRTDPAQYGKWYALYKETLEKLAWILQGFSFIELKNASSFGTVDAAVISILKAFLPAGQVALFENMLNALKQPANGKAYTLFKRIAWDNKRADFQLGICQVDQGGGVSFRIGCYEYESAGFNGDVLFFAFGKDAVSFNYSTQDMVLNAQIYAIVRQAVLDALGNSIVSDIAAIQL